MIRTKAIGYAQLAITQPAGLIVGIAISNHDWLLAIVATALAACATASGLRILSKGTR